MVRQQSVKLVGRGKNSTLMTPRIPNRNLDHYTVLNTATSSCSDPVIAFFSHGEDSGLSDRALTSPSEPRWTTMVFRGLVCAGMLACVGCGQRNTGPQTYNDAEKKAQVEKLLAAYPAEPTDRPEQKQQKEAEVEETLPRVVTMLEEVKTDPARVDEVVKLSMHLVSLVPKHRAANIAYCKAQLAAFFAKEANAPFDALVAINSAARQIERFRDIFDDPSEDERQLFQEVYFNQARREGYFPNGEGAPVAFKNAIENLMKLGFRDAERIRSEPTFQGFFTNPQFAPVLEAALSQIEGSAAEDQSK